MADSTDIDKLRELAEAATPGPWQRRGRSIARNGCVIAKPLDMEDAAFIAAASPDVILALVAELVGLRTEVDQLRGENAELRENVVHMESERTGKCLACGEDWTCSGYYADIAHEARVENLITAERDALQARIDELEQIAREFLPEAIGHNTLPEIMAGIARQRDNQHQLKDHLAETARKLTTERDELHARLAVGEAASETEIIRLTAVVRRVEALRDAWATGEGEELLLSPVQELSRALSGAALGVDPQKETDHA